MFDELNGFYAGFFTGTEDSGLAMFVFHDGKIVGADFAGVLFDGKITTLTDDEYLGRVAVKAPPDSNLIQGVNTGPTGVTYEVDIALPLDFVQRPYVIINTPLGPVNVRFEKIRELRAPDSEH